MNRTIPCAIIFLILFTPMGQRLKLQKVFGSQKTDRPVYQMLRVLICDDETAYLKEATSVLEGFFADHGLAATVETCPAVAELKKRFEETDKPDLCFLDIEMGEQNGIEAAKELNLLCPSCDIAFLTNYISYATDAYETEHFYYVLKEELADRIGSIMKRYFKENDRIVVKSGRKEWIFDQGDIIYIERGRRFCLIKTTDGNTRKISASFGDVADMLKGPDYLRCHNSYIIDLRNMRSYRTEAFVMKDGTEIPISRRYREICSERFLQWQKIWL